MARLDRDRTPALFAVTTSVLSGVILAVLTKALQAGISAGATVLWSAAVSAVVGGTFWVVLRRTLTRSAAAFLVTSAFIQKYYVADLVHKVHAGASAAPRPQPEERLRRGDHRRRRSAPPP
ncbi:hypothetical protein ACWEVP_46030 [Amycolatopsis sp. NPDC003865]